jgi:hypothetical protein
MNRNIDHSTKSGPASPRRAFWVKRMPPRIHPASGACALLLAAAAPAVLAATAPNLGTTTPYGIVSSTYTNANTGTQTLVNGNVCFTTGPVTPPVTITGAVATPCPPAVGMDQGSALANLIGQPCLSLGAGAVALDTVVIGANPPGTIPPGCYSSGGAMNITVSTTVTLSGAGVYVFRPGGALNTGANTNLALVNGACASDVYWAPVGATTLGANAAATQSPTFSGNILDPAGITIGQFAHLTGRALAFGGTVTTDANTISVPTCAGFAAASPVPSGDEWAMIFLGVTVAYLGLIGIRRRRMHSRDSETLRRA